MVDTKTIDIGRVFYIKQFDSKRKIYYEVIDIYGNEIDFLVYGENTETNVVSMYRKQVESCIKDKVLIPT